MTGASTGVLTDVLTHHRHVDWHVNVCLNQDDHDPQSNVVCFPGVTNDNIVTNLCNVFVCSMTARSSCMSTWWNVTSSFMISLKILSRSTKLYGQFLVRS